MAKKKGVVSPDMKSAAVAALRDIALSNSELAAIKENMPAWKAAESARITNAGLGQAIGFGGFNPFGFGSSLAGSPNTINNATTIFENLRWYLVSNYRQVLSQAFVEIGLIQRICLVPVQDGLRGGVEIKSKQLAESDLQDLQDSMDRDNDLNTAGEAEGWNRLFGGAGIIILTDQDPSEPFYIEDMKPGDKLDFRAVDMWELFWDRQNDQGFDPSIQTSNFTHYNYYEVKLHKSRVMRLKGLTPPSFIRPRLRGWGFSVVETLVRSINQYLKATNLGFEVLDEFKLDVYRIKNLNASLMSAEGSQQIFQRVQMGNWQKNYQNALVMDVEDEYDHKQLSFAGLAETMEGIRMQVASDMRMPMTRLFGQSAAGFNSGEDDLEVYNSMVEAEVRNKLKYPILRMIEIRCQQRHGFVPTDLSITFQPLRVMSAIDQEKVKDSKFNRAIGALTAAGISVEEFRQSCNRGEIFDITLGDSTADLGTEETDDDASDEGRDPTKTTDIDDPGANRVDTQHPRAIDAGGVVKGGPNVKKGITSPDDESKGRARPKNSAEFDRVSYEADGGDAWMDRRRLPFFEHPKDGSLWRRAEEASRKSFGGDVKQEFCIWFYLKQGGKFH